MVVIILLAITKTLHFGLTFVSLLWSSFSFSRISANLQHENMRNMPNGQPRASKGCHYMHHTFSALVDVTKGLYTMQF